MTPSSIASVRELVAQSRAALLEPGADLTGPILGLELAVYHMRELEGSVPADSSERALLQTDLENLRLELRRVERLARSGEDFWRGWGRLLGLEPGYTQAGVLAPLPEQASARIAVTG